MFMITDYYINTQALLEACIQSILNVQNVDLKSLVYYSAQVNYNNV